MAGVPPVEHRFKKGNSANPGGRPALPPELAKIRKFSRDEVNALFSKYLRMTKDELREAAENEKTPAIELWLVSSIMGGIKKNEIGNLLQMMERMIGKPTNTVELTMPKPFMIKQPDGAVLLGAEERTDE